MELKEFNIVKVVECQKEFFGNNDGKQFDDNNRHVPYTKWTNCIFSGESDHFLFDNLKADTEEVEYKS